VRIPNGVERFGNHSRFPNQLPIDMELDIRIRCRSHPHEIPILCDEVTTLKDFHCDGKSGKFTSSHGCRLQSVGIAVALSIAVN
jgi:hypothetical protein